MRIAQFADTFLPVVDGVGRVVHNYATTLCDKGHECYVIAPAADTGYRGGYPFELVDYMGAPVPGSPQYKAGLTVLDRHFHQRMALLKFDIVHAHTPFIAGQEALHTATKQKIPLVGTFHSKYYDDFYAATGGAALLASIGVKFVVDFYEHCDEVWAVSESSAEVLNEYGYKGDIKVMENGTEIRKRTQEDRARAVEMFGLAGDEPVLLFVGQQNWKKNIIKVLEAAALLKKRGQHFKLVLAGQGPDENEIEKKIRELDIADITVLTGHITENAILDGLYQRASLFVFPSLYDNAPMVLREAAAMGTPGVLVRGSCAAEIVQDGVNGLLVADDSADIAQVLLHNMNDPQRLKALGECARNSIPIAWGAIIDAAVDRYSKLVNDNHKR
ncbi:MAG: glycosyltransferase [Clostridia bacterium]